VRVKQAAMHLFTMSKILAGAPEGELSQNLLLSDVVRKEVGGANRDRTDDLMLAKHALSQLSYGPIPTARGGGGGPG
jgi:hypothetical protein